MKVYSKRKIIIFWLAMLIFLPLIKQIKAQNSTDLSDAVYSLSEYIAAAKYLPHDNNSIYGIDSILLKAKSISNNDISEALLSTTFATLPFNHIPLMIPVINIKVDIPLPAVEDNLFNHKNENLPSGFLIDSKNPNGDKDKIAHFFGNAFIAHSVSFINLSDFLGLLIELFENTFYVEGSIDARDIIINRLGQKFGEDLKNDSSILPSQYFSVYNSLYLLIDTTSRL
ncbi:MAG: hypothetical protein K8F36_10035 [Melioribacteraceae bacterium]|nr:hypothetical protein [Melioribacteraceae bacterium]